MVYLLDKCISDETASSTSLLLEFCGYLTSTLEADEMHQSEQKASLIQLFVCNPSTNDIIPTNTKKTNLEVESIDDLFPGKR